MKIKITCVSLLCLTTLSLQAKESIDDLPIMPQSYLGELDLDDTAKYAQSNAKGVLKQLEELQNVLRSIKRDLKDGDLGEDVQGEQAEIVEVLAEIIEKNRPKKPPEDQEKSEGEGEGEGEEEGPPQDSAAESRKNAKSTQGLKDSIFKDGGKAGALRKFVEDARASWGRLPEKERVKMKQEMQKKLPKSHAAWIEEFTKALAENNK